MNDDAALLRRYAEQRSEAAFAELVRRHLDLVYSAALRRLGGDAHRAADIAQQVFTTLARDAAKLSHHAVLTAWLYTATRNAAIDTIRAEQRRATREQEATAMHTLSAATPDPDWEKLRPVLDAVMDELSDADRTAVLLRFFEKRPFAEIGTALHLSEDAARMRVDRALEKLHALLAKRGVTSTAAALSVVLANQAIAAAPAPLAATITASALASGAAVVGTVAATETLGYMGTLKLAGSVAASLLLLAALGTGAYAVRTRLAAESELAAERSRTDALDAAVRAARTLALDAEKSAADLKRNVDAARAERDARELAARAAAAAAKPDYDVREVGDAFMAKHPVVRQALGDYARARVNFKYAELFRKLALTPAQIARFQELVASAGMGSDGPDGKDMSLNWTGPKSQEDAKRTESELRELLGADGMSLYRKVLNQSESITVATHLAGSLWFSDTPLSPTQADQLTEVLHKNRTIKDGSFRLVNWEAAMAQAGKFLSAPQLALLDAERVHDELRLAMNRPMSSAAPAPTK